MTLGPIPKLSYLHHQRHILLKHRVPQTNRIWRKNYLNKNNAWSRRNLCNIVQQRKHITPGKIRWCRTRTLAACWQPRQGPVPSSHICKRCVLPQSSIFVCCNSLHPSRHKSVSEQFVLTHLLFMFSPNNSRRALAKLTSTTLNYDYPTFVFQVHNEGHFHLLALFPGSDN
jgi:hypothetical protein